MQGIIYILLHRGNCTGCASSISQAVTKLAAALWSYLCYLRAQARRCIGHVERFHSTGHMRFASFLIVLQTLIVSGCLLQCHQIITRSPKSAKLNCLISKPPCR